MLSQFRERFRFVKRGGGQGPKAGSLKLKEYGISLGGGVDLPCQEVYLGLGFCMPQSEPGMQSVGGKTACV